MIPDPVGSLDDLGRAELLRLLVPVVDELALAVADPPTVAPGEWLGPAADACARLETELRMRLVAALGELDRVLAAVRSAP